MKESIIDFSKKIYKKDSKNKIRVLHVYTDGADLIQKSGLVDGNLIEHRNTCVGKNIGKSNETSSIQQATLEAQSKIETKMTTGYFDSIEKAESETVILPMLAKDYKKELHKVKFPCYIQPKLDGMRALAQDNIFSPIISRKGKKIDTMAHIEANVSNLETEYTLDGELYAHGLSFQDNMRLIKKYRQGKTETVKYHVYDIISDKPFNERFAILRELIVNCADIELVPTYHIIDETELKKFHVKFINAGYEGTIIRHSNAGYSINKRDSQLLKYKDFIDEAYEVIDILPSDKNPDQGVVRCTIGGGYANVTFGCGMKFSHKERKEMLINKADYIGKIAEIRFFEYTDDGIPRFPVCHGFRLDK